MTFKIYILVVSLVIGSMRADEAGDKDFKKGYKLSLINKTKVPLSGFIYLDLINNNVHQFTIPATDQVNENIRAPFLELISKDRNDNDINHGKVALSDALKLAHEARLDLVVIQAQGALGIPVARITDYDDYSTFEGYVGALSDNLTEGEKSIIGKAGQAIGAAGSAYAGSKDVTLPTGTADASGDIATAILSWFNTCLNGFSVMYRGHEYWYKFGNGCTGQEFTLKAENNGTELHIYDKNDREKGWGTGKQVGSIKSKL